MRPDGFVGINHLFQQAGAVGKEPRIPEEYVGIDTIVRVVMLNDKKRFALWLDVNARPILIRANQGHAAGLVDDDKIFMHATKDYLPAILHHGTFRNHMRGIVSAGIVAGGNPRHGGSRRQHVHLSEFPPHDPKCVAGMRKESEVYFRVDAKRAEILGCRFFISHAGAFLCRDTIPPSCIIDVRNASNGTILFERKSAQAGGEEGSRGVSSGAKADEPGAWGESRRGWGNWGAWWESSGGSQSWWSAGKAASASEGWKERGDPLSEFVFPSSGAQASQKDGPDANAADAERYLKEVCFCTQCNALMLPHLEICGECGHWVNLPPVIEDDDEAENTFYAAKQEAARKYYGYEAPRSAFSRGLRLTRGRRSKQGEDYHAWRRLDKAAKKNGYLHYDDRYENNEEFRKQQEAVGRDPSMRPRDMLHFADIFKWREEQHAKRRSRDSPSESSERK
jgi:RNA:NAD 2'-phosphotransferase (TPT1/KptA family)